MFLKVLLSSKHLKETLWINKVFISYLILSPWGAYLILGLNRGGWRGVISNHKFMGKFKLYATNEDTCRMSNEL